MRIRADRDDLGDVLGRSNRAIGTRTALPVLQGLLCEASGNRIRVTGTDLEVTVRTEATVEVLEEGVVVIPGRLAEQAVKRMPAGQVTIGTNDGDVEIVGKGPRFSLRQLSVEDYPALDEPDLGGTEVDGDELAAAIGQVTVAASADAARPILTGVLFETREEGLRLVATDSYRLAIRDLPGVGVEGSGLLPARGLKELPRTVGATKVQVGLGDREGVFSSERGMLRVRMIEGSFPKYQSLVPDRYPNEVVVPKEDLLEALNRVALVAEDHIPVRLTLTDGGIELSVTRQDVGGESEHIPGAYRGDSESLLIAFNPRYLADGVGAVATEEVSIQAIDGLKPSVIRGVDDPTFLYLLMPVRI